MPILGAEAEAIAAPPIRAPTATVATAIVLNAPDLLHKYQRILSSDWFSGRTSLECHTNLMIVLCHLVAAVFVRLDRPTLCLEQRTVED